MKRTLFYLFLLGSLSACNNDEAENNQQDIPPSASAEQQLKDAVKKFPDSLLLKENLIQFYADKGDYPTALKEVNHAIASDSLNPRLWDIRAILYFENTDTLQAIHSFERAIQLFPDPQYIISLGTLYAQTKNPLAIKMADVLLTTSKPKADKEAFFIKGLYHSFINDKINAIAFFDKSLALSYTFMDAYREKAIALYDLGKYNEALEVLDKALTLQHNFDEGYYYSGKCLEKLNRIPEAIQSYQNALQLDPDYIEAKEALGRLGVKS